MVAGGGELVDDFKRRAGERGVAERVHFLGAVPHADLPDVLRASDLFLLTTEPPESFGIVLIEAMAPACPSWRPTIRESGRWWSRARPGSSRRRVTPARSRTALRELVEAGAGERGRMGAAGRERAEREWNWPRLVDRMDAAYAEAIVARTAKMAS